MIVAAIPAGYRPTPGAALKAINTGNGSFVYCTVSSNGDVIVYPGSTISNIIISDTYYAVS
jgi:hypothetical protein